MSKKPTVQQSMERHERVVSLSGIANKAKEDLASRALEGQDGPILDAATEYRLKNHAWFELINKSLREGLCELSADPQTGMMALKWLHENEAS